MAGAATQARPSFPGLRRLGGAAVAACAATGPAHAGAWITTSEGQLISSVAYGRVDDLSTYENDTYAEQPLGRRLSGVFHFHDRRDSLGLAKDEADLGLKTRVAGGAHWTLAAQASGLWSEESFSPCVRGGGEVRALAGAASRSGRSFVNVEAAYRYRPGCSHARYEVSGGFRPDERWLLLAQGFVDDDLAFGETVKVEAGVVRFTRKKRGLQLALRATIRDFGVTEPTLVLGYWAKLR